MHSTLSRVEPGGTEAANAGQSGLYDCSTLKRVEDGAT